MRGNCSPCDYPPDYEHLLLCDGQTISADDYPELVEALGSNVLPNLNGRVLQGGSTVGEYKEAGLPNITGRAGTSNNYPIGYFNNFAKCLYPVFDVGVNTGKKYAATAILDQDLRDKYSYSSFINFDASRSNPIYGASSTVQPPAYTVRYYICYG